MSEVMRICTQCGRGAPLAARYCPHCGYDAQAGLPVPSSPNLPAVIGRAALPVLVGIAGMAARAAWRLVQQRLAQPPAQAPAAPARRAGSEVAPRPRRVIRIRSAWATGDVNGVWQQGMSEHTIELDD